MPKGKKEKGGAIAEEDKKEAVSTPTPIGTPPAQGAPEDNPYDWITQLKGRISALEAMTKANEVALKQMSEMSVEILEKVKNQPQAQNPDGLKAIEDKLNEQCEIVNVLKAMVMKMDRGLRGIA